MGNFLKRPIVKIADIADSSLIIEKGVREFLDTYNWTKGLELNKYNKTACAYEIVMHEGKEFLILEWKSGDYSFAGRIQYYVLTRE